MKYQSLAKARRAMRVRAKIRETANRPRLSVFRSGKFTYAQIISDEKGITLVSVSEKELKASKVSNSVKKPAGKAAVTTQKSPAAALQAGKTQRALALGALLAKKAAEKGIKEVSFDRGHYRYHGRIKALADSARQGGLIF